MEEGRWGEQQRDVSVITVQPPALVQQKIKEAVHPERPLKHQHGLGAAAAAAAAAALVRRPARRFAACHERRSKAVAQSLPEQRAHAGGGAREDGRQPLPACQPRCAEEGRKAPGAALWRDVIERAAPAAAEAVIKRDKGGLPVGAALQGLGVWPAAAAPRAPAPRRLRVLERQQRRQVLLPQREPAGAAAARRAALRFHHCDA